MTIGEFELARQAGGRGQYGFIQVQVQPGGEVTEIALDLGVEIRGNGHVLHPMGAEDWIAGALLGCREAVNYAQSQKIVEECQVKITRIEGSYVDTLEEQMRIVAFMAVWEALTAGLRPLKLAFQNERWEIV